MRRGTSAFGHGAGLRSQKEIGRWRRMPNGEYSGAEDFLKEHEKFCVAACSRFLRMRRGTSAFGLDAGSRETHGHVWYSPDEGEKIAALLLHSRRSLLPVFGRKNSIPAPRFLRRFLGKVPIHAIQGLREDTELLESLMKDQGYFSSQRIDYQLMNFDCSSYCGPKNQNVKPGPNGLLLRPPGPEDEEGLFALQSAYEKEEVLPQNSVFNPAACRLNLQHILTKEHVLVAELNRRLVGKINTSAESFTRYQIGGVYVHPDFRGLGIGVNMAMAFAQNLLNRGKGLSLFVKKRNIAACKVYHKIGFNVLADYMIIYY